MNCCSCRSTPCCPSYGKDRESGGGGGKKVVIDFLYLDLEVCNRCQGTESALEEAVKDVAKVLEMTGAEVVVNKVHIDSEEKAVQYRLESSPTIRVNGKDIQLMTKESLCESCGELCGDEVDCRVWVYNGREYTVPPKAMIVEAVLKEVYGGGLPDGGGAPDEKEYRMPENLKKFFALRSAGKK